MPIIVACPSCQGQLRVADDLIGRKVRCPACSSTFEAQEPPKPKAAPPPPPPPPEPPKSRQEPRPTPPMSLDDDASTERLDPWKQLDLELSPREPEPPPKKEAVEKEPPADRDDRPRRRARLSDDHDDLQPCPTCGRMAHRNARHCVSCGTALRSDPEDDDYDDLPRRPRRHDCLPHRGGFILGMGITGLVVSFACWPLAVLALVPAIIAWVQGGGDLAKMKKGEMDPEGESSTRAGWICGIIGTLLNLLIVLGCGAFFGFVWLETVNQSQRMRPQAVPVAPQQKF